MRFEKGSRMRGITVVVAGFVASGFLLLPGCGGTSVETGGDVRVGYAWDTLRARLEDPIDEVYRAANDAMHQLDLEVLWRGHDGASAGSIAICSHRLCAIVR
jgi:hypothetical protein